MPHTRLAHNVLACTVVLLLGRMPLVNAQESTGTPGAMTSSTSTADAPMYRGNPAGTGEVPGSGPVGPPVVLWMAIPGMSPTYDQPTPAAGDGIVVTSGSTGLVAFDAETGAERWRVEQPTSPSSPLVWDGMVYVGTAGEGLKAFDAATGEEVWQFLTGETPVPDNAPPDSVDSSPTIADGTLYVGEGGYGGLYALDPATGVERWRFDTHGATWTSPAVADGVVYITTDAVFDVDQEDPRPSALYAVDAATGQERWHADFGPGENSFSSPAVANGAVFFGITHPDSNTGYYLAVDAATGTERWRFALDKAPWEATPGASGDLAYLSGGDDTALIAVDAATGEERWRHETGMAIYPGPMIADGVLYLQSQDGHLTALDATTGEEMWRMLLGGGGSPVVVDGTIYTGGWGNLFALGSAGTSSAASLVTQPAPPASGPGSEDTPFPAARSTKYGSEPGGYWIWEPITWAAPDAPPAAGPFPVILFLSGCCGNGTYPTPEEVDPWMSYLARQGYVIIAPVFHHGTPVEDSRVLLQQALAELEREGHAAIDPAQFGAIGFSYGGMSAVMYAATAAAEGLPTPSALFLTAPCTENGFCLDPPEEPLVFPEGMKAVVIGYDNDHVIGIDQPHRVFETLASLPAEDRDFVSMTTDGHGLPPLYAGHDTTYNQVDAADRYAIWKLSDALFACAFTGEDCSYALGNTPEQRFMGLWSDGVPVTELLVTDDPAAAESSPATPVP